jgi:cytoskeleton protein RodZ
MVKPSLLSRGGAQDGFGRMAIFPRRTQDQPETAEIAPASSDVRERPPSGIGRLLREARQSVGGDIDRIGAALRIRPAYLEAIEEGRHGELPGPTYVLGFVRSYADFLGLDGAEAVRRFKAEIGGIDNKADLAFPMPLAERSVPGGAMLLAALILAVCGYGIWYYVSASDHTRPERMSAVPTRLMAPAATESRSTDGENGLSSTAASAAPSLPPPSAPPSGLAAGAPTAPSAAAAAPAALGSLPPSQASAAQPPGGALAGAQARIAPAPSSSVMPAFAAPAASPGAAVVPARLADIPEVPPAPSTDAAHVYGATTGPARIVIRASADSWVQVRDNDQSVIMTRVLHAGEVFRVPDHPGITLRTGNAGALDISVDGRPVPSLGGTGMVRRNVALDPVRLSAGSAAAE